MSTTDIPPRLGEQPAFTAAPAERRPSLINRIVATSITQRFLVVLLAIMLVAAGIWSFTRLPVDAYPDLSPPIVEVITQWPGHASEEVERLITVPVEVEMNGLPNLHVVRSVSLYGLSDVSLTFDDGTDLYFARQQVFERLPDVEVPEGVSPSVGPLSSPSGLVYRYVLQSPDRSPMELKNINDWVITKAYKSVPGVAEDSPLGGETMQYQVLLDPTRLAGSADFFGRSSAVDGARGSLWPTSATHSAPTTATPAAGSTPRVASSTMCADSGACTTWKTSATSWSPCTTALRSW